MKIILTKHAMEKLQQRKVLEDELIDTIKRPNNIVKEYGKYYYQKKFNRGTLEVVVEQIENNLNVITLYWV